ncbi:MAG: type I-C CRISPR-associated endonuclease Cas1 [Candidatus Omnitrophica bacterium]|nr:type I-C CRISPR-associated endonuclease Cas1 [Candidatus Omnitrophota bacterium]
MKKYLNTLFVTTQGAYLNKEGETLVVSVEKEVRLQVPVHTLSGLVCFGQVAMSPQLMSFCAERDVSVSFLTEYGRFLAAVRGEISGNVLLRREQYRLADDPKKSADIARYILTGKIANSRSVLSRALRDHGGKIDVSAVEGAANRLGQSLDQLRRVDDLDVLRGVEGESAHSYFKVFDHLIVAQKKDFIFSERNRRPPLDKVNALLSFIYTLLTHDARSALEAVGLDPYVGFLHRDRPGRPGLALDMIEEFRSVIADRLVLSLINREQVSARGFKQSEGGAVVMDDETRKIVLVAYQKRKQEEIEHPFIKETMPMGLMFFMQALLMARYLRGDIDGYPVFIWR